MTAKRILLGLIRGYQYALSPFLGAHCRYFPSCSEYTYQAIMQYGVIRGGWMGVRRLMRCHPWHPGGMDPVPEFKHKAHEGHNKPSSKSSVK